METADARIARTHTHTRTHTHLMNTPVLRCLSWVWATYIPLSVPSSLSSSSSIFAVSHVAHLCVILHGVSDWWATYTKKRQSLHNHSTQFHHNSQVIYNNLLPFLPLCGIEPSKKRVKTQFSALVKDNNVACAIQHTQTRSGWVEGITVSMKWFAKAWR